jgi:hypothetical protein
MDWQEVEMPSRRPHNKGSVVKESSQAGGGGQRTAGRPLSSALEEENTASSAATLEAVRISRGRYPDIVSTSIRQSGMSWRAVDSMQEQSAV